MSEYVSAYEDVPFESRRHLVNLIGESITVNIPAKIIGVGSKAVLLEVSDIYGERQTVSVPIEKLLVTTPSEAAGRTVREVRQVPQDGHGVS